MEITVAHGNAVAVVLCSVATGSTPVSDQQMTWRWHPADLSTTHGKRPSGKDAVGTGCSFYSSLRRRAMSWEQDC